ncbi:MAG TPA: hypothetical protein PK876_05730 [Elusimicrobiota bacterium]|nr:hypothetical protein [Elusimicrobiota bacterium]
MTYKETDYPELLREIHRLGQEAKKPVPAEDLMTEVLRLQDAIPVYPGIISMCLRNLFEEVSVKDLQPGDRVSWAVDGGRIYGTVKEVQADGNVSLSDATLLTQSKEKKVKGPAEKFFRLRQDVLKKTWPSLVFEE